ncbi:MAG: methyltransferase domain-containing protein [Patescibacteria group bacterium]|jgi:2-polyprenyl-3-methyl-5-hydroxy-6-metoxy-1,4-benzoquinol methylase
MNEDAQKKLLKIVKNNYEEIADEFHQTRMKNWQPLWGEVVKFASRVKDGESILDLGCGNGRVLNALAGKKISYIGIDNSSKIIEHARSNYQLSIINYQFIVGDILGLDKIKEVADRKFDYIFCVAVLHHIPGQELRIGFLRQAEKYLKPGGKMLLTSWNIWEQKRFYLVLAKSILLKLAGRYEYDFGDILFPWKGKNLNSLRYYHAFTKGELKRLAEKSGCAAERIFKDKFNYYLVISKKP